MSVRAGIARIYNITADEAYRVFVILRDGSKAAVWLRNRYRSQNPLDKWASKFAAALMLIGGAPGFLSGIITAILLTNNTVPPMTSPYYIYYIATFAIVVISVTVAYYGIIGRRLLVLFENPLRLEYPYEYVASRFQPKPPSAEKAEPN